MQLSCTLHFAVTSFQLSSPCRKTEQVCVCVSFVAPLANQISISKVQFAMTRCGDKPWTYWYTLSFVWPEQLLRHCTFCRSVRLWHTLHARTTGHQERNEMPSPSPRFLSNIRSEKNKQDGNTWFFLKLLFFSRMPLLSLSPLGPPTAPQSEGSGRLPVLLGEARAPRAWPTDDLSIHCLYKCYKFTNIYEDLFKYLQIFTNVILVHFDSMSKVCVALHCTTLHCITLHYVYVLRPPYTMYKNVQQHTAHTTRYY